MPLLAGDILTAASLGTTVSSTQAVAGTTTSTTYTATLTGGTACAVAFTAPASGLVLILYAVEAQSSTTNFTACTIRVGAGASLGAGTEIVAASDDNAVVISGTSSMTGCRPYLLSGLASGSAYNVQQRFRVGAGTGTWTRKVLVVVPVF